MQAENCFYSIVYVCGLLYFCNTASFVINLSWKPDLIPTSEFMVFNDEITPVAFNRESFQERMKWNCYLCFLYDFLSNGICRCVFCMWCILATSSNLFVFIRKPAGKTTCCALVHLEIHVYCTYTNTYRMCVRAMSLAHSAAIFDRLDTILLLYFLSRRHCPGLLILSRRVDRFFILPHRCIFQSQTAAL